MPFIDEIIQCHSVSIVGLEKNTGKTECLNYILGRIRQQEITVAVTSIGIDGEGIDQVTNTAKPEISLKAGTIFSTSEKFYRRRRLLSEVLDVDHRKTTMGRLITARALTAGKILLSGPSSTRQLVRWMERLRVEMNVDLFIVDGALSRMSLASPVVSEAMVLTTGAAYSLDYDVLVRQTLYVVELVNIPVTTLGCASLLGAKEDGAWVVDVDGGVFELPDFTVFSTEMPDLSCVERPLRAIYLSGALTDRFLKRITDSSDFKGIEIIVSDFTKIFASILTYRRFLSTSGQLTVLRKSKLLAICVNPVSPTGVIMDSDRICREISAGSGLPVYDIIKNGSEI